MSAPNAPGPVAPSADPRGSAEEAKKTDSSAKVPRRKEAPSNALPRAVLAPILWLAAGAATAVAVVMVVRGTDPPRASSESAKPNPHAAPAASEPLSSSMEFAELYLAYLLKSYYVDARGFCPNLLSAICSALVTTDLIANEKSCAALPNADLVLAIGRYQNGVGLPVDGKAGPETVRMILGGDFGSRREMANKYCPGSAAPAASH
jgi:hypothetical protein